MTKTVEKSYSLGPHIHVQLSLTIMDCYAPFDSGT